MSRIVWIIFPKHFPGGRRAEKELEKLLESGVGKVHVYCDARKTNSEEDLDSRVNVHGKGWWYNSALHPFALVYYLYHMLKIIRKGDVVHVHDIPMCLPAIIAARVREARVVCDLHDNYPARALEGGETPFFMTYPFLVAQEFLSVVLADKVIVAHEEDWKRIKGYPLRSRKVFLVRNFPSLKDLPDGGQVTDVKNSVLCLADKMRKKDLEVLLDAFNLLRITGSRAHLILLTSGDVSAYKIPKKLQQQVSVIKVRTVQGYDSWQARACIAIAPVEKFRHRNVIIPGALYRMMNQGLPLLVPGDSKLARDITEKECGITYSSKDPKDLAQKISSILSDTEKIKELGTNGKKAVLQEYNWEKESEKLLKAYQDLWPKSTENMLV